MGKIPQRMNYLKMAYDVDLITNCSSTCVLDFKQ